MTESSLLVVNEIFFSIQGESSYAGRPCAFVRLAYCNLRCSYCDTPYAFQEGASQSVDEVFDKVTCFPTNLVEVTGGEPLLQDSVHTLVERLLAEGKTVLIETGGSLDIRPVHRDVVLIYDIKCPGSGMADRNLWDNLRYLRKQDEIKFVISSREDYEWAKQVLQERGLSQSNLVLFSPAWQRLEARVLAEWILADGLPVRFQVQLHKHLWGDRRGV